MKKRSVAAVVILTLITCGIYGYYWLFVTARDLQKESGTSEISPVVILLLSLFVSVAGTALLGFDANTTVNALKAQCGMKQEDNKILWIVLGALIPIVLYGLIQNEVNHVLDQPPMSEDPASSFDSTEQINYL